jgi:hypothetical protein
MTVRIAGNLPAAMHVERPLWVTGCLRESVSTTTGVPQIADDLLHRPTRQSRANSGDPGATSGWFDRRARIPDQGAIVCTPDFARRASVRFSPFP